jgi:hypothetical protein
VGGEKGEDRGAEFEVGLIGGKKDAVEEDKKEGEEGLFGKEREGDRGGEVGDIWRSETGAGIPSWLVGEASRWEREREGREEDRGGECGETGDRWASRIWEREREVEREGGGEVGCLRGESRSSRHMGSELAGGRWRGMVRVKTEPWS